MPNPSKSFAATYAGMLLISLATLAFEILLTRIFSVTMWNHLAFVAVSVAMFGMTVGAVCVYVFDGLFSAKRTPTLLSASALLFGVTAILSFHAHLWLGVKPDKVASALSALAATYIFASVPFVMSGICISLALTHFSERVSRLYAADLLGGALGCLILSLMLNRSDGPTAIYGVGFIASVGAYCFAKGAGARGMKRLCVMVAGGLAVFIVVNVSHINSNAGSGIIHLKSGKDSNDRPSLYEHWNSYSRVEVLGDLSHRQDPRLWGSSPSQPSLPSIQWLDIVIDGSAATVLTRFDGDLSGLGYLAWDVTNIAHAVKQNASVLVVGSGGGRDLLSAIYFGQKSALGVEMNSAIVSVITGPFAAYCGDLTQQPPIRVVNDEARSYVTRTDERFDMIEISLVDTWAATAAGAFVTSENTLYTSEAWKMFLSRLNPGGLLSVSRWYLAAQPELTFRLVALANKSLQAVGVANPREHIALISNAPNLASRTMPGADCLTTILVSRDAFTNQQLLNLRSECHARGFKILLDPIDSIDPTLAALAGSTNIDQTVAAIAPRSSPPTDDKPFFFQFFMLSDLFNAHGWHDALGTGSIYLLAELFLFILTLSLAFVILPVWLKSGPDASGRFAPLTLYFLCIGIGFMMIEIAQLQRLVVLLGHPAFSLTVVLFSLLIFSGIGSLTTAGVNSQTLNGSMKSRWLILLAVLVVTGFATTPIVHMFQGATTPMRIAVAIFLLAPAGLFMGMAFPLGMKWAVRERVGYIPWLWAVNGAASVCASVVTVIIAMTEGISAAWWCGVACYAVAAAVVFFSPQPKVNIDAATEAPISANLLT